MKQYCRYCVNLCVNNVPYCNAHQQCLSRSYCTHTNNCKDFVFADVEPEYQDAFGETNGYHPRERREPKKKQIDGQISLFESEDDDVIKCIKGMPSVNPQEPKTGHWEQYGYPWEDRFKCSECGEKQPKILCGERIIEYWSDYCPNCGCRMVEPQESEG